RKLARLFDQAADLEVPLGGIEQRHAAVMQHGPFDGQRLTGRQASFGAGLLLEFPSPAIVAEQWHGFASNALESGVAEWFHGARKSKRDDGGFYTVPRWGRAVLDPYVRLPRHHGMGHRASFICNRLHAAGNFPCAI